MPNEPFFRYGTFMANSEGAEPRASAVVTIGSPKGEVRELRR